MNMSPEELAQLSKRDQEMANLASTDEGGDLVTDRDSYLEELKEKDRTRNWTDPNFFVIQKIAILLKA